VSTKIGYSVTMLYAIFYIITHSYILYEVLHWGLLNLSNEHITHLKRIALNLKVQWNYSTSVIIFYIKTKSNIM